MCKNCIQRCICECGIMNLVEQIRKNGKTIMIIAFCEKCSHEVLISYWR
jgi:hypothetical protein